MRDGLNDAGARIGLCNQHQPGQAIARHDAVRIQHHHVAIVATPSATKIADVAALALDAVLAPAIEDAPEAVHRAAKLEPRSMLIDSRVRVRRVRQDEKVEAVARTCSRERFVGGAQARENARYVFIADRHYDGRARVGGDVACPCVGTDGSCDGEAVPA